jgi:glycosyltransferase involved in cell wall biosynthesis
MPRVAGIIVNLVPYHHARWEAFARLSGGECHLVELTDRDAFKVLEFSAIASYRRHTLFPRDGGETISSPELRRAMAAKLDMIRPEVVCVSGWALPVSLAALSWAARNRVPAVMLSESNEFDEARTALKEWMKRQVVALCSAGLVGGTPQADYLSKLGLPRESIFSGYDVVDNAYFAAGAAKARSREEGAGKDSKLLAPRSELPPAPFFLACCRFGEKKNLPGLIEAFARYRQLAEKTENRKQKAENTSPQPSPQSGEGDSPWDLVIVGDGELRGEIEAVIARFGMGQSVHLAGAKSYSEIPAYYASAGAFIHASTTEQWGLVVNEAMASGLPVLVSNRCGCATDLVQEGVNGFTFDPRNVEQMAQMMFQISGFQPFRLSAFGDASRQIISNWGPERFAQGLKDAAHCAQKVGVKRASWFDRLLLCLMLTQ